MPLYDYACTKCGHTVEVRHGFDESYEQACAKCGAPMRRVFNAAPILFKGSGFYVTDSRKPGSTSKPVEKAPEKAAESKTETSATKAESKPSDSAA
jgi:putative FmdB family regulatory protein